MDNQTIYDLVVESESLFDDYIFYVERYGGLFERSRTAHSLIRFVQDNQAKFNAWTSLIGAGNTINSLDYRLGKSPEIRTIVMSMLKVLNRSLGRGKKPRL